MDKVTEIKKGNTQLGKQEYLDVMKWIFDIQDNMEHLWDHADPDHNIRCELSKYQPNYQNIESASYQATLLQQIDDQIAGIREMLEVSYEDWSKDAKRSFK